MYERDHRKDQAEAVPTIGNNGAVAWWARRKSAFGRTYPLPAHGGRTDCRFIKILRKLPTDR